MMDRYCRGYKQGARCQPPLCRSPMQQQPRMLGFAWRCLASIRSQNQSIEARWPGINYYTYVMNIDWPALRQDRSTLASDEPMGRTLFKDRDKGDLWLTLLSREDRDW